MIFIILLFFLHTVKNVHCESWFFNIFQQYSVDLLQCNEIIQQKELLTVGLIDNNSVEFLHSPVVPLLNSFLSRHLLYHAYYYYIPRSTVSESSNTLFHNQEIFQFLLSSSIQMDIDCMTSFSSSISENGRVYNEILSTICSISNAVTHHTSLTLISSDSGVESDDFVDSNLFYISYTSLEIILRQLRNKVSSLLSQEQVKIVLERLECILRKLNSSQEEATFQDFTSSSQRTSASTSSPASADPHTDSSPSLLETDYCSLWWPFNSSNLFLPSSYPSSYGYNENIMFIFHCRFPSSYRPLPILLTFFSLSSVDSSFLYSM
jgi:hypothetical protein